MATKKLKKINIGPIMLIIFMSVILLLLSFILNKIGFKGYLTDPETHQRTIITVNNIFSRTGLKYIFNNAVFHFRLIEPIAILIMSFIAISIFEASGLLNHILKPFKNAKSNFITFFVLFISMISTFFGDYCYAILLPLFGLVYKYLGSKPKNGIMISFVGITIGYSAGVFYNYQDVLLGHYSTLAAQDVISTYTFEPMSLLFIKIVSTLILCIVGTNIVDKKFNKKVRKNEEEEEKFIESNSALRVTSLVFIILLAGLIYMIIPGLPFSGLLLDDSSDLYITNLLGDLSPFTCLINYYYGLWLYLWPYVT